MHSFLETMTARRSIYGLGGGSPLADDRIIELVKEAVKHTPSAFHMQSARAVLLFGEQHRRFWGIAVKAVRSVAPESGFASAKLMLDAFAAAHGTVLFYEDTAVVDAFANSHPLYRDNFPVWAQQANGMLQFAVWNLLESEGLGASLQHYNPLVDDETARTWDIPSSWKLIAQMPFGEPIARPDAKTFLDVEERVRILR